MGVDCKAAHLMELTREQERVRTSPLNFFLGGRNETKPISGTVEQTDASASAQRECAVDVGKCGDSTPIVL